MSEERVALINFAEHAQDDGYYGGEYDANCYFCSGVTPDLDNDETGEIFVFSMSDSITDITGLRVLRKIPVRSGKINLWEIVDS
jgi:predicted DCC family thiol-disulfide oxidoreductase YuxK